MWLALVTLVVVVLLLVHCKQREEYRRIPTFLTPNRCTDGCIYRQRNRGVFVDEQCMSMCNDQWAYNGASGTYSLLSPEQQNQRYYNNLVQSIASGAFVYDDGLLS